MLKTLDVVAICNALVDLIYDASDEELSSFGLTKGHMHLIDSATQAEMLEHFHGRDASIEVGGSALNAMRALAFLEKRTAFAGMVARDRYGESICNRLDSLGVENFLQYCERGATGTSLILVTPDGERTMNTSLGASCLFGPSIVPFSAISAAKILHVSAYQWSTRNQTETIGIAIRHALANDCRVSLDLADPAVVGAYRSELLEVIESQAHIVFANEEESRLLYGTSHEETAQRIAKNGAVAVIKLGKRGSYVSDGNESFYQDAVPTTVVDTTAAGDMFAAGFLFGWVADNPLRSCAHTASVLASDVISRYGAVLERRVITEILTAAI